MLFYYDTRYWAMLLPVLLITIYAQCRVSANFNRYSKVTNLRRLTGAQAAEAVLHRHGVYDVRIERVRGRRATRCSTQRAMAPSACAPR